MADIDIPEDIFNAAYDAASIATDVGDLPMVVAEAVYPVAYQRGRADGIQEACDTFSRMIANRLANGDQANEGAPYDTRHLPTLTEWRQTRAALDTDDEGARRG